jgi:hypothetical protein
MTIILQKAYKQLPCEHIYTNAPEKERGRRGYIGTVDLIDTKQVMRRENIFSTRINL